MDKYENEHGKIGVIVSGGFGAGWSTWWGGDSEFLSMDKTLVEMKLNGAKEAEVEAYCQKVKGDSPYMGGWANARVVWLDKGTSFTIEEYDGSEGLILVSDLTMTA
jgi:hypothetical protein